MSQPTELDKPQPALNQVWQHRYWSDMTIVGFSKSKRTIYLFSKTTGYSITLLAKTLLREWTLKP